MLVLGLAAVPAPPLRVHAQAAADPPCCVDLSKVVLGMGDLPGSYYKLVVELDGDYDDDPQVVRVARRDYDSTGALPPSGLSWIGTKVQAASSSQAASAVLRRRIDELLKDPDLLSTRIAERGLGDESAAIQQVYRNGGALTSTYTYVLARRGPYVVTQFDWGWGTPPPVSGATQRARIVVDRLNGEIAKQIASLPTATPIRPTATATPPPSLSDLVIGLEETPLVHLVTLRDLGEQALSVGDLAALAGVAEALSLVYMRVADEAAALGAVSHHEATAAWAGLLAFGADQAVAELARQQGEAAVAAGDLQSLYVVAAVAQNQQERLERVRSTAAFAGYHRQLSQFASSAAGTAAQAYSAAQAQSPEASGIWAAFPAVPAPADVPIAAGLLPVPVEFQAVDVTTGRALFGQPPTGRLWDLAKTTGPACDGPRQRPKFVVVAGQGGATSAYPAGCFRTPDPAAQTQLPVLEAPPAAAIAPEVERAKADADPLVLAPAPIAPGAPEGQPSQGGQTGRPGERPPGVPPPTPGECRALAKSTDEDTSTWRASLERARARLQEQLAAIAARPAPVPLADLQKPQAPINPDNVVKWVEIPGVGKPGGTSSEIEAQLKRIDQQLERLGPQSQSGGSSACPPAGQAPAVNAPSASIAPPGAAGAASAAGGAPPGQTAPPIPTRPVATATREPARMPTPAPSPTSSLVCIDARGQIQINGGTKSIRLNVSTFNSRSVAIEVSDGRGSGTYSNGRVEGTYAEAWMPIGDGGRDVSRTSGTIEGTVSPDGRGSGTITASSRGGPTFRGTWTTTRNVAVCG